MTTQRNQPTDMEAALQGLPPLSESLVHGLARQYERNQHLDAATRIEQLKLAVRCLDLTSLSGGDTPATIRALCDRAQHPWEATDKPFIAPMSTAAVCVYPTFVPLALKCLDGTGVGVASVAAGFPTGLLPLDLRLTQIEYVVGTGADEVDVVAPRHYILQEDWSGLYEEIRYMRQVCAHSLLKVILETGSLPSIDHIAKASAVAMAGGADFIKTSTGKEEIGATLEAGVVMARAIQAHYQHTGYRVGLKPAGGIRSAHQALQWILLMQRELGDNWLHARLFRMGASSLLDRLQQQLRLLHEMEP